MTSSISLKLYGVPLSQPFRTVAWALLQRNVPFEIQLCVPGMSTKIGAMNPDYIEKNRARSSTIPVLEVYETTTTTTNTTTTTVDGDDPSRRRPFVILESPAILAYLCQRFGWEDWYPTHDLRTRTTIDSYMHWHHNGTRRLYVLSKVLLRPNHENRHRRGGGGGGGDGPRIAEGSGRERQVQRIVDSTLASLEQGWLANPPGSFVAGGRDPTIADLLAYGEITQAHLTGLLPEASDESKYPNVCHWVRMMRLLPYHDEAHAALTTLGDLSTDAAVAVAAAAAETDTATMGEEGNPHDPKTMLKRLGDANKTALKSIAAITESWKPSSSL